MPPSARLLPPPPARAREEPLTVTKYQPTQQKIVELVFSYTASRLELQEDATGRARGLAAAGSRPLLYGRDGRPRCSPSGPALPISAGATAAPVCSALCQGVANSIEHGAELANTTGGRLRTLNALPPQAWWNILTLTASPPRTAPSAADLLRMAGGSAAGRRRH